MPSSTPIINGVDFVAIPTRDFQAALHFYETVLVLPCSRRYARVPGGEFEAGNLTLQVVDSQAAGLEHSPHRHPIALHVEDLPAARARLEAAGVAFNGETLDTGVCLMAFFEDPDGNALMLHHRYAPPQAPATDATP